MNGLITMSKKELSRLEIMQRVADKRLSQHKAAELLGLTDRHISRLYGAYKAHGASGLVSKKRGKSSNRKISESVKKRVLGLIRDKYFDFGPTFAHEKLTENHGFSLNRETLRHWMIDDGIWEPRAQRAGRAHQPRHRRACFGELIQIDGCDHHWFEKRAPSCTLLVYIDDATSRLVALRFVEVESAFDYFGITKEYLLAHGRPMAFYSDRHSVFHVYSKDRSTHGPGVSQFCRALDELNIDLICANSSQAKGRVERANLTLQDRLVKELRLRGISSKEAGNAFLPHFMADYNRRFAKPPRSDYNAHRPLLDDDDLDVIFTWQETRKITKQLTLRYKRNLYLIDNCPENYSLRGKQAKIYEREDDSIFICSDGRQLKFSRFDKEQRVNQAEVVSNKRLGAALKVISVKQQQRDEERLSSKKYTLCQKKRIKNQMGAQT